MIRVHPNDLFAGMTLLLVGIVILVWLVSWLLSKYYKLDGMVEEMRETIWKLNGEIWRLQRDREDKDIPFAEEVDDSGYFEGDGPWTGDSEAWKK